MYGIIFDMDGVLVDSARPHFESWRRLGEELGRTVTDEAFLRTFGLRNQEVIARLFGDFDAATAARLGDRKEEIYRDLIRHSLPVTEGVVDFVRACRAEGFRLAVGSSGPPENVALVLDGMGLAGDFDACVTGRDVTHGKPHPEVFLTAADRLGLPASFCAVIEDAPAGIEAALAAGMVAVGLLGSHPADSLRRADRIVASFRELKPGDLRLLIESARRSGG